MTQTRAHSAIETTASTAFGITVVYTVLSLVRGYVVRRLFNRLQGRRP